MEITREQQQQLLARLNATATHKVCPMCNNRNWSIEPRVFELREFNDGNLVIGGENSSIIPVIPMTCNHCGNIQFLNAIVCGVVSNTPSNQNQEQDGTTR